ncbi:hypothetical protein D3C76_1356190 [compost metagenome]
MQQVSHAYAGMAVHGRVETGDRILQLEAPFALGHAQQRGKYALAYRPGQVRGGGSGGGGVALVEDTAVADDQQGVGADAAAVGGGARGEGVGVDGLPVEGGRVVLPVRVRPVLGFGGCQGQAKNQ